VYIPVMIVLNILLGAVHFLFFDEMDFGLAVVLFTSHSFALWVGGYWWRRPGAWRFPAYLAGLAVLFFFLVTCKRQILFYPLAVVFFAAAFSRPVLLAFMAIYVISIAFCGNYWVSATLIGWLLAAGLFTLLRRGAGWFAAALFLLGGVLVAALAFPLIHSISSVTPQTMLAVIKDEGFRSALWLTVQTATISTVIVLLLGVPLAYVLARGSFAGKPLVNALVDVPILIPQTIVGLSLMNLMGPKTALGVALMEWFNLRISGSAFGIIAVQIFVATPFLVRTVAVTFGAQAAEYEKTARSLGASAFGAFFRVSLPLAGRGILAGVIMAWARAASESGALMIIAYKPMTVPIYINDQFIQYGLGESLPPSAVLVFTGFWIFLVIRLLAYVRAHQSPGRGDLFLGGAQ